ncbi:hypothetical protein ACYATP_01830 [Lactobacillaceae bacterium Melli_B4]
MIEFDAAWMLSEIKRIQLDLAWIERCYSDDEQAALIALQRLWQIKA